MFTSHFKIFIFHLGLQWSSFTQIKLIKRTRETPQKNKQKAVYLALCSQSLAKTFSFSFLLKPMFLFSLYKFWKETEAKQSQTMEHFFSISPLALGFDHELQLFSVTNH